VAADNACDRMPPAPYHVGVDRAADLSRLHVIVPVRALEGGKARLGGALDAEEREELIVGMLRRLLREVAAWGRAAAVEVVSPDPAVLALAVREGATPVAQGDQGLNAAISQARSVAMSAGATAILVVPADLPLVSEQALRRVDDAADAALAAGRGAPVVVVAAADARSGTNALLLAPPDVIDPAFGEESCGAHLRAASAVGASVRLVTDPDLGFDLDTPDDLDRLDPRVLAELQALGAAP